MPLAAAILSSELSFPDWHRQVIWGFTVEVAKSAPVLGVGPNAINLLPGANELIPDEPRVYPLSSPQLAARNWRRNGLSRIGLICHLLLTALKTLGAFAVRWKKAASGGDHTIPQRLGSPLMSFLAVRSAWRRLLPASLKHNKHEQKKNKKTVPAKCVPRVAAEQSASYSGVEHLFDLTTPRLERKRLY